MGNDSYPVPLTQSGTTNLKSCLIYCVSINKTLAGTLILKEGSTAVANFAATTPPGSYHIVPEGARYSNFNAALSTTDDVTVYMRAQ